MNCENHPNRRATWLRKSWIIGNPPVPICDECKHNYEQVNLNQYLELRPIVGGIQGRGGERACKII